MRVSERSGSVCKKGVKVCHSIGFYKVPMGLRGSDFGLLGHKAQTDPWVTVHSRPGGLESGLGSRVGCGFGSLAIYTYIYI